MKEYGYCRISTNKQSIERQVRNILSVYPNAIIVKETYTGTKQQGREKFNNLIYGNGNKGVQPNDTVIFDSVSRMSRNADEGFALYEELYNKGVNLVFLKEPHINTAVYKNALENQLELRGDKVDFILEGVNKYLFALAKEQKTGFVKVVFCRNKVNFISPSHATNAYCFSLFIFHFLSSSAF